MAVFNPYKIGIWVRKSLGKGTSLQAMECLLLQAEVIRGAFQRTETGLCGIVAMVGLKVTSKCTR